MYTLTSVTLNMSPYQYISTIDPAQYDVKALLLSREQTYTNVHKCTQMYINVYKRTIHVGVSKHINKINISAPKRVTFH